MSAGLAPPSQISQTIRNHAAVNRAGAPRRCRKPTRGATAVTLVLLVMAPHSALTVDDNAQLREVRSELDSVQHTLASDTGSLGLAREKSFALAHKIEQAELTGATLSRRISDKKKRVDKLATARKTLENNIAESRALLEKSMVARYALSMQPKLKLLLNQEEVSALSRNVAYFNYINATYESDIARLGAQLQERARTEEALKLESNSLQTLRFENDSELARLKQLHSDYRLLVDSIEQRMAHGNNRVEQLQDDERRVMTLVEKLVPTPAPAPTQIKFAELKGKLAWPANGTVTKAPGSALRAGGARWAGVIVEGPPGAEVKAIASGRVVFADWFRNLGKLLIIDHGDGFMTLYGNTAQLRKKPGETVLAGDTIATIGAGPEGQVPGVYFELRADGQPLDPRSWCAVH